MTIAEQFSRGEHLKVIVIGAGTGGLCLAHGYALLAFMLESTSGIKVRMIGFTGIA